ncbi:unnamed protein product [Penicillium bialowiezense]
MDVTSGSFHLFGDFWLDGAPEDSLGDAELHELFRYMPHIERLDYSWKSRAGARWDLETAFKGFSDIETAMWKQMGSERPAKYLLPPSGSIGSPIACHLFNPTFYVEDVDLRVTDDPTSPTLQLMHESGFSSTNCFIFDQICRRESSWDLRYFWTEENYRPHREFVNAVRQNMSAIVEICWGRDVWKEMERAVGSRLIRLPLWGIFQPVRLHLELTEDHRSLKRFIIQVDHPQFFVRSGLARLGPEARAQLGEVQDLALTIAMWLAGTGTSSQLRYFRTSQPLRKNCRISRRGEAISKSNLEAARKALATLYPERARQLELQKNIEKGALQDMELFLQESTHSHSRPMITHSRVGISEDAECSRHSERSDQLTTVVATFQQLHQGVLPCDTIRCSNVDPEGFENIEREYVTWETLPKGLARWLQAQEGLRINGEPIASRSMLETACRMLYYRGSSKRPHVDPTGLTILELGIKVALGYIKQVTSTRNPFIRENTVPGISGHVIRRKCSACKMFNLDDAFPLFSIKMPDRYVIRVNMKGAGCGRPGCKGNPAIIPTDPRQKYVAPDRTAFDKALRAEEDKKMIFSLLRSGSDLNSCPSVVVVKCPKCINTRVHSGRWTIHEPPRFVQPHLTCTDCGNRQGYFRAVDPTFETITEASLYSTLKGFREVGCVLFEFPKLPEIIFAKASYKARFEMLKHARDGLNDRGANLPIR